METNAQQPDTPGSVLSELLTRRTQGATPEDLQKLREKFKTTVRTGYGIDVTIESKQP